MYINYKEQLAKLSSLKALKSSYIFLFWLLDVSLSSRQETVETKVQKILQYHPNTRQVLLKPRPKVQVPVMV